MSSDYVTDNNENLIVFRRPTGNRIAAADLLTALQETANLLEVHRFFFEDEADDIGCDAGNWDGGGASNCKHCQLKQAIEEIDQILGRASMAIAVATGKEIEALEAD